MAKPNYEFEKRQKELAQKRKKEEKRLKKLTPESQPQENPPTPADESKPVD